MATPRAEAAQAGAMAVQGTALVGAGISYPCTGAGVPDVPKCGPPAPAPGNPHPFVGPLPGNVPTPTWGGNAAALAFTGVGAGVVAKAAKAKCPGGAPACVEAGTFTITPLPGSFVTGWCGLTSGTVVVAVTPAVAIGTKANGRVVTASFITVGGVLIVGGSTSQAENIFGTMVAIPNAANGSSCTNKAAKMFIVVGTLQFARV